MANHTNGHKHLNFRKLHEAWMFAAQKHEGQIRDGGSAYLDHPCEVADMLMVITNDVEIIQAAYLHDTLEDTDTTYEELCEHFGKRVANLVKEVTHKGTKEAGYYFPNLKTKDGILLKFADRISNLCDMDAWDIGRQEHYLGKSKFWKSKENELTHKQLMKENENLLKRIETLKRQVKEKDNRLKKFTRTKKRNMEK